MICRKCGAVLERDAQSCYNCGEKFGGDNSKQYNDIGKIRCMKCGKLNASDAETCIVCGKTLRKTKVAEQQIAYHTQPSAEPDETFKNNLDSNIKAQEVQNVVPIVSVSNNVCKTCGAPIEDGAFFCGKCRNKIEQTQKKVKYANVDINLKLRFGAWIICIILLLSPFIPFFRLQILEELNKLGANFNPKVSYIRFVRIVCSDVWLSLLTDEGKFGMIILFAPYAILIILAVISAVKAYKKLAKPLPKYWSHIRMISLLVLIANIGLEIVLNDINQSLWIVLGFYPLQIGYSYVVFFFLSFVLIIFSSIMKGKEKRANGSSVL